MKMKKIKLTMLCAYVVTFVLELLPWGVEMAFANPEGEPWRHTYCYFDLTPYGYANFWPLLTGILTVALLILTVIFQFTDRKGLLTAVRVLGCFAVFMSVLPFLYGVDSITVIGVLITLLLIGAVGVSFVKES